MTTATRIYLVTAADKKRLVRAGSQAQALRHVARDFTVEVATPEQTFELAKASVEIEEASA